MSFRETVTVNGSPSSPPVSAAPTGRVFLPGRTERGLLTPQLVRGLADFRTKYGSRVSTSQDLYDVVRLFSDEGGPEVYVLRAVGPNPVKASRDMATGGLVTTAKFVGAYGNAINVTYTSSSKTVTVIADGVTQVHTGADAAALVAAINAESSYITATSNGTLPGTNQAAANLTGGDDDHANLVPATLLTAIPADLGPGLIGWPGKDYTQVGTALADHAAATNRLAVPSLATGSSTANALTAAAAVAAYTNASHCAQPFWPATVLRTDGVEVNALGLIAAARARAHTVSPGTPPWGSRHGRSRTGVTPALATTDATLRTLDLARVNVIHQLYSVTTLNGWHLASYIPGNTLLDEASQRDTLACMTHDLIQVTSRWAGSKSRRSDLTAWAGALKEVLANYANTGDLIPPDPVLLPAGVSPDPGYTIDVGSSVNTPTDLATGNVEALINARLAGSMEFLSITISAADASAGTFA